MENKSKWTYEIDNFDTWDCEYTFDTKEEAIAAGREAAKEVNRELRDERLGFIETFRVGEMILVEPKVDAARVIEDITETMYDQTGIDDSEWLERPRTLFWANDVTAQTIRDAQIEYDGKVEMLSFRLTEVFMDWLKEIGEDKEFYTIENVETCWVDEGDKDDH